MSFFEKKGPGKSASEKRSGPGSAAALAAAAVAGAGVVLANSASASTDGYQNVENVVTSYVENANGTLDVTMANGTVQTIPAGEWQIANGQLHLTGSGLSSVVAMAGSAGAALLGLVVVNSARATTTEEDAAATEIIPAIEFTLDQQDSITGTSGADDFTATHETMHSTDAAYAGSGYDTLWLDMHNSDVTMGTLTEFEDLNIQHATGTLDLNGTSFSERIWIDDYTESGNGTSDLTLEGRDSDNQVTIGYSDGSLTLSDSETDLSLEVYNLGWGSFHPVTSLPTNVDYYEIKGSAVTSATITETGESAVDVSGLTALKKITVETDSAYYGSSRIAVKAGVENSALTAIDASAHTGDGYYEIETGTVTEVTTGSGSDLVDIEASPTGTLTINYGAGDDYFNPDSDLSSAVDVINGEEGIDQFVLAGWDFLDGPNNTFDQSSGDLKGALLNGGVGDDRFGLFATEQQTGVLTMNGDAGDDTFNIEGGNFETLKISGGEDADNIYLGSASVGLGQYPTSVTTEQVVATTEITVDGGDGNDQIDIWTVLPTTHTIEGGDGDDEIGLYVDQVDVSVTVNGGVGDDTLYIKALSTPTDQSVNPQTTTLEGGEGSDTFDLDFMDGPVLSTHGNIVLDMGALDGVSDLVKSQDDLVPTTLGGATTSDNHVVIKNFETGANGDELDLVGLELSGVTNDAQMKVHNSQSGGAHDLDDAAINIINYADVGDHYSAPSPDITHASQMILTLNQSTTTAPTGVDGVQSYVLIDDGTDTALWHIHEDTGGNTSIDAVEVQLLYVFEGVGDAATFTVDNFTQIDALV